MSDNPSHGMPAAEFEIERLSKALQEERAKSLSLELQVASLVDILSVCDTVKEAHSEDCSCRLPNITECSCGLREASINPTSRSIADKWMKSEEVDVVMMNLEEYREIHGELRAKIAKLEEDLTLTKKERDNLASFNPDWDRLRSAYSSLREHMRLVRAEREKNTALTEANDVLRLRITAAEARNEALLEKSKVGV